VSVASAARNAVHRPDLAVRLRRLAASALLLSGVGCNSVHAWTADRPFTPLGGVRASAASPRGLASLHRLLLPTPSCVLARGGRRDRDEEQACAREIGERAFAVLRDERGYDVLLPEVLGSAGGLQAEAARALAASLGAIERFAFASRDGEPPPPQLASRVRDLCAAWRADGLVLLRVEVQPPSVWNWLLLAATLLQSWPVLVLGQHADARIDVFEAETGAIVWRYAARLRPIPQEIGVLLAGPFAAIEPAAGTQ
jgi:hypothetical protein